MVSRCGIFRPTKDILPNGTGSIPAIAKALRSGKRTSSNQQHQVDQPDPRNSSFAPARYGNDEDGAEGLKHDCLSHRSDHNGSAGRSRLPSPADRHGAVAVPRVCAAPRTAPLGVDAIDAVMPRSTLARSSLLSAASTTILPVSLSPRDKSSRRLAAARSVRRRVSLKKRATCDNSAIGG